jgi:mRNA export factor
MAKCSYGAEPAPITCGAFNADGSIYAYALSYDWSKGFQSYNPAQMPSYIHLHGTQEAEVRLGRSACLLFCLLAASCPAGIAAAFTDGIGALGCSQIVCCCENKGFQPYNPAQMPSYTHLHRTQEAEVCKGSGL